MDDARNELGDTMKAVFDVSCLKHPERWAYSISTDGVSARLLVHRKEEKKGKLTAMPERGSFTVCPGPGSRVRAA